MSDTEIPIIASPRYEICIAGNSLVRFRQASTCLHVFELSNDGKRLEINDDGHIIIFDLSREQASALVSLLSITACPAPIRQRGDA